MGDQTQVTTFMVTRRLSSNKKGLYLHLAMFYMSEVSHSTSKKSLSLSLSLSPSLSPSLSLSLSLSLSKHTHAHTHTHKGKIAESQLLYSLPSDCNKQLGNYIKSVKRVKFIRDYFVNAGKPSVHGLQSAVHLQLKSTCQMTTQNLAMMAEQSKTAVTNSSCNNSNPAYDKIVTMLYTYSREVLVRRVLFWVVRYYWFLAD